MKAHCEHETGPTLFCAKCGKLKEKGSLDKINLAGFVGVRFSTSPAIEEFWHTGDPETPGL